MKYAAVLVAFFWTCAGTRAAGATILWVGPGEEYTTILSAIEAAGDGDTVQVLPGTYIENITLKEGVDVIGSGAGESVIRSLSESFPFATVDGKDNATLRGFTVTGGYYGIRCAGASPTISECVIWRNASCGIVLEGSSATISRCLIAQNPRSGVECLASTAPAISNCTISANGYGVFSSESQLWLANSILWENWDDLGGFPDGNSISHCDFEDGDFQGDNGNISVDPGFVAWGLFNNSDNALYVDVGHTGTEDGTRDNPFMKVERALSVYSYHLGTGSPCLNAGEGGSPMGAYPDDVPSRAPGNKKVTVNVAPGTYLESRLFACHGAEVCGSPSPPARIVAFGDTVFFVLGQSSVENFVISGGDDAIACFFSSARISSCVILECGQNGIYSLNSTASIERCHMRYNFSAGVTIEGGEATVRDCFISQQGLAGIVCMGGAVAKVENCLLTRNPVGLSCGGGSSAEVRGSTVANNDWRGLESRDGAEVTFLNSIAWENAFGEVIEEGGSIAVSFSNVKGGFPGEGNISADPLFESGPLGDFYLDSDSPCVDSGSGTAESLGLDSKTTSRRGETDAGIVDMGYHYERFEIGSISLADGQVTLEWNSTPQLDYAVFGASALSAQAPGELLRELTASWFRETYSFDEPDVSAEFYRIARP